MKVTEKKFTKTNISTHIGEKKRRAIQTTYVYLTDTTQKKIGTNEEKKKYLTSLKLVSHSMRMNKSKYRKIEDNNNKNKHLHVSFFFIHLMPLLNVNQHC